MDKQQNNANYLSTQVEHVRLCGEYLDNLNQQLCNASLKETDYFAIERLLQVIIEAAIGFAKQWVKHCGKIVRSNAYDNFIQLHEMNLISADELKTWKSVIGLRNILVHEYLNIRREVIDNVLQQRTYHQVVDFIRLGSKKW